MTNADGESRQFTEVVTHEKLKAQTLADVRAAPQTRLVTTGTMVGLSDPTDEEVRDLMQVAGSTCMKMRIAGSARKTGCVLIPKERARKLQQNHTVYCAGLCPVCILAREGYTF